jgi:hypothetical protein
MLKIATILYIVENDAGNANLVDQSLKELNIRRYFFDSNDGLQNKQFVRFAENLPPEALFCHCKQDSRFVILIPIVSSHVNTPVKATESVWFYPINKAKSKQAVHGVYFGRAHGLLNTEDVGLTLIDRDNNVYSKNKSDIFDLENKSLSSGANSYESFLKSAAEISDSIVNVFENQFGFKTHITENAFNNIINKIKLYNIDGVERNLNKSTDTVLQGTYGSIIKLTDENASLEDGEGSSNTVPAKYSKVDLIAGLNKKSRRISPEDSSVFKVYKPNEKKIEEIKDINISNYNSAMPVIDNGFFKETVKSQRIFAGDSRKNEKFKENIRFKSSTSFDNDLSKLVISESGSEIIDFLKEVDFNFQDLSKEILVPQKNTSNIKNQEKTFKNFFYAGASFSSNFENTFKNTPSVACVSNNIVFSLHKDAAGVMSFLKPNTQDDISSHITLTNLGNIVLSAPTITIGESKRYSFLQNGKTPSVFIGGSSNDSQSLVLGEQLKEFIEEINNVKILNLKQTRKMLLDTKSVFDTVKSELEISLTPLDSSITAPLQSSLSAAGPPGAAAASVLALLINYHSSLNSSINKINSKIDEYQKSIDKNFNANNALSDRLDLINQNLDSILSKLAKTV